MRDLEPGFLYFGPDDPLELFPILDPLPAEFVEALSFLPIYASINEKSLTRVMSLGRPIRFRMIRRRSGGVFGGEPRV